jgi:hypothetical protein
MHCAGIALACFLITYENAKKKKRNYKNATL